MQFGAFFLIQYPDASKSIPARYDEVFEQIEMADELGFDIAWFAEHHFSNYGLSTNPLMVAVRAAERTRRIRLAPAVLVVPFYHPLRMAEDVAMADVFAGGRMVIGVCRGYQAYEFERFGLKLEDSRAMFAEGVDLMIKAWTERDFNVITTAGLMDRSASAQVSQAVRTAERQAGKSPGSIRFGLQRAVHVTQSSAEARAHVEDALWTHRITMRYMRGIADVRNGIVGADPVPDEPTPEEVYRRVLFGTPDEVAEKLEADIEATGASLLNCFFGGGAISHSETLRSMGLFAEEVMPRFARQPVAVLG